VLKRPNVIVYTGNRSEYGLLSSIIKALHCDAINLRVLVVGDHHEATLGYSRSEIDDENVEIYNLPYGMGCANNNEKIAFLIAKLDALFATLAPDVLVIYGDRYETFAAAVCAHQRNIKIVHLEGGDITEGGVHDDSIRHAISKLATFHLPSNAESASNLIRLGEEPWRVKVLGLANSDLIAQQDYTDARTITERYGLDSRTIVLFTIHPIPGSLADTEHLAEECTHALENLDPKQFQVIITYPNSDPLSDRIITAYHGLRRENIQIVPTLGRRDYHGILAINLAKRGRVVCAGNSSSGVKEAGFFRCIAVNIGQRQRSRLKSGVVIDCEVDFEAIGTAIRQACDADGSLRHVDHVPNPYQPEISSDDVRDLIISHAFDPNVLVKRHLLSQRQL
jgi:UDP-hydrolysing UDP-N-acetyl-D-glucosamine 2-epimerase